MKCHCIALHNITLTYATEQNTGSYTQHKLSIYYVCYTALHYIAFQYTYTLQFMMPYARLFMMPYVYNMIQKNILSKLKPYTSCTHLA